MAQAVSRSHAARLPREEFSSRYPRTLRTPYFAVRSKKNGGLRGRLGVVVGKAAAKTAVKRNFLKRQARAVLSPLIATGTDILVVFSRPAADLTKKQLKIELRNAVLKAQT